MRTPLVTTVGFQQAQPIMFDHRHHTLDEGIDCKYCHIDAERSPFAGVPPLSTCMGCHGQIWNGIPQLAPLRDAYFQNHPLPWARVHSLPDFVYFSHEAHVNRGVGCVTCHGRVDQMANVHQVESLQMGWCLDCHRNPDPNLRPQDRITDMDWKPPGDPAQAGREIRKARGIAPPTNCTGCHR